MFEKITRWFLGNKDNPLESLTVWGLAIYFGLTAVLEQVCSGGAISQSMCTTLQGFAQTVGSVLTVLGVRRAGASSK